ALDTATAYLVSAEPALAAAGSLPYLHLLGTVLGGWLMGRVAATARHRKDERLTTAKLATARFYAEHFLARAPSYLPAVMGGATVTNFDPDWL
ncbi:MAG: acyl-CoA dehydrogenase C-terminal domain-containing protein, partial [Alphaproteobacteria bacterium]|nr:acyl-CoA dehydrogenase C-terminal domain-containing protein [Alphaproteobacteria bacterium]